MEHALKPPYIIVLFLWNLAVYSTGKIGQINKWQL